jgi:hypothetical protein
VNKSLSLNFNCGGPSGRGSEGWVLSPFSNTIR